MGVCGASVSTPSNAQPSQTTDLSNHQNPPTPSFTMGVLRRVRLRLVKGEGAFPPKTDCNGTPMRWPIPEPKKPRQLWRMPGAKRPAVPFGMKRFGVGAAVKRQGRSPPAPHSAPRAPLYVGARCRSRSLLPVFAKKAPLITENPNKHI